MLQLLSDREYGLDPPWLLPRSYGSHRFSRLELSKEKELARAHSSAVNSLDLDSDGRYLISGGGDMAGSIVIHDIHKPLGETATTHKCQVAISTYGSHGYADDVSHAVSVVQWFPHDTGIFTTTSGDKYLKIWDTNELMVVEKFKFKKPIYTHTMSISSSHTLTAVGGDECEITLCDLASGSSTHVLRCHLKPVMSLTWSPCNDHVLASGSKDNQIVIWDIRKANGPLMSLDQHNGGGASSNTSITTAHGGYVNGLCFTPDGLYLVSFGTDDRLRLWNSMTGRNTLVNYGRIRNTLPMQTCPLAFSPQSSTLHPVVCVPVGGEVVLLDVISGKKIRSLSGHFGNVHSISVHPIEQELYSGGSDTNILCWTPAPKELSTIRSKKHKSRSSATNTTVIVYDDAWSSDEEEEEQ